MKSITQYIQEHYSSTLDSVLSKLDLSYRWVNEDDEKTLCKEYKLDRCTLSVEMPNLNKSNKYITIDFIKSSNKGSATRFLTDICSWADANDRILCLTPTNEYVGIRNFDRLVKLYKRFGFKDNDNTSPRSKNRQEMQRNPQTRDE